MQQVVLTAQELEWEKRFASLGRDVTYGLRRFPSPTAFTDLVGEMVDLPDAPSPQVLQVLAQRDWHIRGQNGCMFARLAPVIHEAS